MMKLDFLANPCILIDSPIQDQFWGVGLFIFLILFSWIVALAADPYAGLPSEKERKNLIKKRKERRSSKDAL